MNATDRLRRLSLWWDTLPESQLTADRPPLEGIVDADVAIVGAGYTALWTAYYLQERAPDLRIVLLDAEVAGFGASGRNGGWCSSHFPVSLARISRHHSPAMARAMKQAMHDSVDEVGRAAHDESIDCDWQLGGGITMARTELQLEHLRQEVDALNALGFDEYEILDAAATRERVDATRVLGSMRDPHMAAIHPAKLARGLALAVEQRGATIHENSRVTSIGPGVVDTDSGRVRARYVVRATEGFTPALPGEGRTLAPVYSLMLATEPLPDEVWERIGLRERQTFTDARHLIIYGQRTADNRIAFGGRGARYHLNSAINAHQERNAAVHRDIWERLIDMLPPVADFSVTHTWGGPLGVPRDWSPSVGLDPRTGMAWSGGYVGDGVSTSNLGGRTLADLITGRDSELTRLPWVNHRSRQWEPEPLRWVGIRAGNSIMSSADHVEARTGKDSLRARAFTRFIGG